MNDRVPNEMQEGIGNHLRERFFDADVSTFDSKFDLFAELAAGNSPCAQCRAFQNLSGGNEAQTDEPLFKSNEAHAQIGEGTFVDRCRR